MGFVAAVPVTAWLSEPHKWVGERCRCHAIGWTAQCQSITSGKAGTGDRYRPPLTGPVRHVPEGAEYSSAALTCWFILPIRAEIWLFRERSGVLRADRSSQRNTADESRNTA